MRSVVATKVANRFWSLRGGSGIVSGARSRLFSCGTEVPDVTHLRSKPKNHWNKNEESARSGTGAMPIRFGSSTVERVVRRFLFVPIAPPRFGITTDPGGQVAALAPGTALHSAHAVTYVSFPGRFIS